MILIPALNNAVAFNGDFLLASSSDAAGIPTVCRVVQAVNTEELIVTWLLTREQILQRLNLEPPPTVPIEIYNNVFQCKVQELFEVRSSFETIRIGSILDIAFVFHIQTLESKLPNCAGMTRVFFVRYFYDNGLVELHSNDHAPFSQVIIDSYPSRIWYTIADVKEKVEKCLNDKRQYQMCKKMQSTPCSLEAWTFLAINLVRGGAIVIQFSRRITKKHLHCDLSLSTSTEKQPFTLIRIDSCQSMSCARNIFGLTFGIGVRNRPPNKGEDPVRLHYGDVINVVDVASNNYDNVPDVRPERRNEFVSSQGVDFIYDKLLRLLKIRVRYSKSNANNPLVKEALHLSNLRNPPAIINELDRWVSHVNPGTYFATVDGKMASVVRVDGNNVFIFIEDNDNEVLLDINEAA